MYALKPIKQLSVKVSSLGVRQTTTECDEIKELATAHKFQHDELDHLLALSRVDLVTFANLNQLDYIAVIELPKHFELTFYALLEVLATVDNLDCIAILILVSSHLDFA